MIKIVYFKDGEVIAEREREHVPSIGDVVKIGGCHHCVDGKCWVEDDDFPRVQVTFI